MKRKRKRSPGRYCTGSGYTYEFKGKRRWRRSSSELWETVTSKVRCGRKVGERTIDGSRVVVVTVGGKYYAQLPSHIRKAP